MCVEVEEEAEGFVIELELYTSTEQVMFVIRSNPVLCFKSSNLRQSWYFSVLLIRYLRNIIIHQENTKSNEDQIVRSKRIKEKIGLITCNKI